MKAVHQPASIKNSAALKIQKVWRERKSKQTAGTVPAAAEAVGNRSGRNERRGSQGLRLDPTDREQRERTPSDGSFDDPNFRFSDPDSGQSSRAESPEYKGGHDSTPPPTRRAQSPAQPIVSSFMAEGRVGERRPSSGSESKGVVPGEGNSPDSPYMLVQELKERQEKQIAKEKEEAKQLSLGRLEDYLSDNAANISRKLGATILSLMGRLHDFKYENPSGEGDANSLLKRIGFNIDTVGIRLVELMDRKSQVMHASVEKEFTLNVNRINSEFQESFDALMESKSDTLFQDLQSLKAERSKKLDALTVKKGESSAKVEYALKCFSDYALLAVLLSDPDKPDQCAKLFKLIEALFIYDDESEVLGAKEGGGAALKSISQKTLHFIRNGRYKDEENKNVGRFAQADIMFRETYLDSENQDAFVDEFVDYSQALKDEAALVGLVGVIKEKHAMLEVLHSFEGDEAIGESRLNDLIAQVKAIKPRSSNQYSDIQVSNDKSKVLFNAIRVELLEKLGAKVEDKIVAQSEGDAKLADTVELSRETKLAMNLELTANSAAIMKKRAGAAAGGAVLTLPVTNIKFLIQGIPRLIGATLGIDNDVKTGPKELMRKDDGLNTASLFGLEKVDSEYEDRLNNLREELSRACMKDKAANGGELSESAVRALAQIERFILGDLIWQFSCARYNVALNIQALKAKGKTPGQDFPLPDRHHLAEIERALFSHPSKVMLRFDVLRDEQGIRVPLGSVEAVSGAGLPTLINEAAE